MTLHHFAEWFLAAAILSCATGAVGLVAAGLMRRADPAWRSTVLGAILCSAVVAPILLLARAAESENNPITAGSTSPPNILPAPHSPGLLPAETILSEAAGAAGVSASVMDLPGTPALLASGWRVPALLLAAVWLTGIAAGSVQWGLAVWRLHRIRRGSTPGMSVGGIPVHLTSQGYQPACAGAFRPWILLPANLKEQLTPDCLQAVLRHEAAHARHRDVLWLHLQRLALLLHWWNPGIWLTIRQFSLSREELCDRAVIATGIPAPAYAQHLLDAARLAAGRTLPASAGASASFHEARKRIIALMKRPVTTHFSAKAARMLTALLAAGILAGSTLIPARIAIAAEPEERSPAEAQIAESPAATESTAPSETVVPSESAAPAESVAPAKEATPTSHQKMPFRVAISAEDITIDPADPLGSITLRGDVKVSIGDEMQLRAQRISGKDGCLSADHPAEMRNGDTRLTTNAGGVIRIHPGRHIETRNCTITFANGASLKAPDGRIATTTGMGEEAQPAVGRFSVMGEVARPGRFQLNRNDKVTLLDSIAMAGGLSQFARPSAVRILRGDKVAGTYDVRKLTQEPALNPELQHGDIIVVPVD